MISSTETRSVTYTCDFGTLSGTNCLISTVRTYDAVVTCDGEESSDATCAHTHTDDHSDEEEASSCTEAEVAADADSHWHGGIGCHSHPKPDCSTSVQYYATHQTRASGESPTVFTPPEGHSLGTVAPCDTAIMPNLECKSRKAKVRCVWDTQDNVLYMWSATSGTWSNRRVDITGGWLQHSGLGSAFTPGRVHTITLHAGVPRGTYIRYLPYRESIALNGAAVPVPVAPENLSASCSADNTMMTLEWDAPPDLFGYSYTYMIDGSPAPTGWRTSRMATFPVVEDQSYTFTVKAHGANKFRWKRTSEASKPLVAACGGLGRITGQKCAAVSDTSITVEWDELPNADKIVTHVHRYPPEGRLPEFLLDHPGDSTRLTLSGLSPNQGYTFVSWGQSNDEGVHRGVRNSVVCITLLSDGFKAECGGDGSLLVTVKPPPLRAGTFEEDWRPMHINAIVPAFGSSINANQHLYMLSALDGYRVIGSSTERGTHYSLTKGVDCSELTRAYADTGNRWPDDGGIDPVWKVDLDEQYHHRGTPLPFPITGHPGYERSCSLSGTTWTCTEHWSEPMKAKVKQEWHDIALGSRLEIVEAQNLTQGERSFLALNADLTIGNFIGSVFWTADKAVRLVIADLASDTSGAFGIGRMFVDLFHNNTQYVYMFGPTCIPGVSDWVGKKKTGSYTTQVGGYTIVRNFTIHYCGPAAASGE